MKQESTAIILAAGSGKRMKSGVPKQLMEICGRPLIYYSLKAFEESSADGMILVCPPGCEAEYEELFGKTGKYPFSKLLGVTAGGAERYDSVKNALSSEFCSAKYVLVHDGARCCITKDIIERVIADVISFGACIAAVPSKDTVKMSDNGFVGATLNRSSLYSVQTPQAFERPVIMSAYDRLFRELGKIKEALPFEVTDDSVLVERFTDRQIKITEGAYTNIKVTTPEDMVVAELILKKTGELK